MVEIGPRIRLCAGGRLGYGAILRHLRKRDEISAVVLDEMLKHAGSDVDMGVCDGPPAARRRQAGVPPCNAQAWIGAGQLDLHRGKADVAEHVEDIAGPFLRQHGLNYFQYCRVFADGSTTFLVNNVKFVEARAAHPCGAAAFPSRISRGRRSLYVSGFHAASA